MTHTAMRSPALPVLFVLVVALTGTAPGVASGQEIDVTGNWQFVLQCVGPASSSTSFWQFTEDIQAGELTVQIECGMCILPPEITGKVTGTSFAVPTTGVFTGEQFYDPPVVSPGSVCGETPVAHMITTGRLDGIITDADFGAAVRIAGDLTAESRHFDANDDECLPSLPGPGIFLCPFVMLRTDTPIGPNQTVEPLDGATVTFSDVQGIGTTSVTPLTVFNAALPPEFELLGVVSFDVTSTVVSTGPITVCLPYQDEDSDGFVDDTSPPLDENFIRILHEEEGVFRDRTVSRDPNENQVCAVVTDLSQFVLGSGSTAFIPSVSRQGLILFAALLLGTSLLMIGKRLRA